MSTTPATLDDILAELKSIHALLASRPAPTAAYSGTTPSRSPAGASSQDGTAEISQPTTLIDNPGDVQVHFGKNTGTPLSNLSERSLAWYATEQPARLDSSGKPYPRRPVEINLLNAARQLWHMTKGTLAGGGGGEASKPQRQPAATQSVSDDENVPF